MIGPLSVTTASSLTLAIGPEGGIEADEMELLERAGFRRASVSSSILRFETAAIVALGIARVSLMSTPPPSSP
jgi:16S rRNA (uracil1498-N3)-methyltransferase